MDFWEVERLALLAVLFASKVFLVLHRTDLLEVETLFQRAGLCLIGLESWIINRILLFTNHNDSRVVRADLCEVELLAVLPEYLATVVSSVLLSALCLMLQAFLSIFRDIRLLNDSR